MSASKQFANAGQQILH